MGEGAHRKAGDNAMSTRSKIPLSFGFMLATISASAAMSNPGNIRSSEEVITAVQASPPQEPTLGSCTYRGGPKSASWTCP
jgi:hypothetical protein